jgi:hypothetical protein
MLIFRNYKHDSLILNLICLLRLKAGLKSKGRSPNPPINTDELETTNRDLHHY